MFGTKVPIYLFIHIQIQGATLKCKQEKFTAVSVEEPINTNQIKTAENLYQAYVSIQELRVNDIVDRLRSRHMRRLLEEHYQVLLGYKVIGRRGLVNDREESARGKKE